jgi:hypothetical protein
VAAGDWPATLDPAGKPGRFDLTLLAFGPAAASNRLNIFYKIE